MNEYYVEPAELRDAAEKMSIHVANLRKAGHDIADAVPAAQAYGLLPESARFAEAFERCMHRAAEVMQDAACIGGAIARGLACSAGDYVELDERIAAEYRRVNA